MIHLIFNYFEISSESIQSLIMALAFQMKFNYFEINSESIQSKWNWIDGLYIPTLPQDRRHWALTTKDRLR